MSTPRRPLYQRLPEIYRIRDAEQRPAGQLQAWLDLMEQVMGGLRDNVEALYHDLFIDTCDDWVIPYLADLLGTSHLAGDPWTLRADVARTIFHRRRKGTLAVIESLGYGLTGWAVHAVESRRRLVWLQHLNHQRPDRGGVPPLALVNDCGAPAQGGVVNLRDPARLALLHGPFDPFAHLADVRPGSRGAPRYNLPNLGIYLWRLQAWRIPLVRPGWIESDQPAPGRAVVRCILHPQADPMVLFNSHRFDADRDPPELSELDAVPGPMAWPRIGRDALAGSPDDHLRNPSPYVEVAAYDAAPDPPGDGSVGLILHLPRALAELPLGLPPAQRRWWHLRGGDLFHWERCLNPPLRDYEIVVDPLLGRVLFGLVDRVGEADPLRDALQVSYRYGSPGPTGAQPVQRDATPAAWGDGPVTLRQVGGGGTALTAALAGLGDAGALPGPLIVEIRDSLTYDLDPALVDGHGSEGGAPTLTPDFPLWIRATGGQRPVVRLARPLRFRPADLLGAGAAGRMARLQVWLQGLHLTWDRSAAAFAGDAALIEQAALDRLLLDGCTLDPGGALQLDSDGDGIRQGMRPALRLGADYGFIDDPAEELAFDQTPVIEIRRGIVGACLLDTGYRLELSDSLVDAGSGVGDAPGEIAIGPAGSGDGPELTFHGITCFGQVRVFRAEGEGGIFLHRLWVQDHQTGCIRFSCFSGAGDRLPANHGCIGGGGVRIAFRHEWFGRPGYGQLRLGSDPRLLEQGPGQDAMGAFGYLRETHKWKNLSIRFREFVPVGTRPVLIPVT
ncbi:MAG TPA: hypothetical protein ENI96_13515 [Sedimenticola thiotaurini]|uniref:Tail protein n=1 Tax=Sedimenticola thiotaurini TaxID=1543721 RepID=A0A831RMX0_9GAMM|nr:hypothetical protein [Sedimenticola thiotaurini]